MVTFLKNETYRYGSQYSLKKSLICVSYSNLVWNLALLNLAKRNFHIKYGFDKSDIPNTISFKQPWYRSFS